MSFRDALKDERGGLNSFWVSFFAINHGELWLMKKLSGTLMIQILAREPATGFEPRAKKSVSCIKLKVKKFLRRQKIVQFTKCESVHVLSKRNVEEKVVKFSFYLIALSIRR